jgi:hypothetical protein
MALSADLIWKNGKFGQTSRRDSWWRESALVLLGLTAFIVYVNWAAWQGEHYTYGPYLSPFYSPELVGSSPHAWFGPKPSWYPDWLPFSPALFILWAPGLFRFTCYYYRGAYYKSHWADPPACAVSEPRKSYLGEHSLPLLLQNSHRYFMYLAMPFLAILSYDAVKAFWFDGRFGIGLGSLLMTANVILIGCYVFGCHSFRHYVGGFLDRISARPTHHKVYNCVSCLNRSHKKYAWASLLSVASADIYIRLCSMGILSDWRIL